MTSVFISHSSLDKDFVKKLASDLLANGVPVWLDSWDLEIGDSLLNGIYDGLEASSYLLLVVSQNSFKSDWVNKELNAALTLEHRHNRSFIIPLILDDVEVPLKVADRLYLDFSDAYNERLTALCSYFDKNLPAQLRVPRNKELICPNFTNEVHLDQHSLSQSIQRLQARTNGYHLKLNKHQIVVRDDADFTKLASKLYRRIDKIATDPFYSPQLEKELKYSRFSFDELLDQLRDGVSHMIADKRDVDAIYWYCKIVRGRIVYELYRCQIPSEPDILNYGSKWSHSLLLSNEQACQFFETSGVSMVNIWFGKQLGETKHFNCWLSEESANHLRTHGFYCGPMDLVGTVRLSDIDKYILPQMYLELLRHPEKTGTLKASLQSAMIGLA
jgi:TIR domain